MPPIFFEPRPGTTPPLDDLTLDETGAGRPVLVLHGGGGPATVTGLSDHLAATHRVLTPTHPGWNGTARPDWLTGVDDLALAYLHLLEDRDLRDVLVVGSSVGGWVGAEMAVRDAGHRIGGLVLLDAVGIEVEGQPITDFFGLDAPGVAERVFYDSERFFVDPASLGEAQQATQRANAASLRVLAGDPPMRDPKLRRRLARVRTPTLVVWGDSDGIVSPAYGRAYADAFAEARFEVIADAGHLPHVERPGATYDVMDSFTS